MFIEINHSQQLSKRFKKDVEFKCVLFPVYKSFIQLEDGIMQVEKLRDNESLFSVEEKDDIDDKIKKYETEKKHKTQAMINYQYMNKIKTLKDLRKCKWHRRLLEIVPIKIKKELNPIPSFRFLSQNLYLDSDIFLASCDRNTKEFRLISDIYDYKRACSVMYDDERQVFDVKIHEKVNEANKTYNNLTFNYYIDWLKSLGNSKALFLIDILLKLKNKYETRTNQIEYSENAQIIGKNKLLIIKKLDDNIKKFIYQGPWITRTSKTAINDSKKESGLCAEEYSMSFLNQLGYKKVDKDEIISNLVKLGIQTKWYTKNFYNNACDTFEKLISKTEHTSDPIKTNFTKFKNFIIKNKFDEPAVEAEAFVWEELWYEDDFLFKKTYILLTDIKEVNIYSE